MQIIIVCFLSADSYFTDPKPKHTCGDSVCVTSKALNSYLQVLADLLLGVVGFGFELRQSAYQVVSGLCQPHYLSLHQDGRELEGWTGTARARTRAGAGTSPGTRRGSRRGAVVVVFSPRHQQCALKQRVASLGITITRNINIGGYIFYHDINICP